MGRSAAAGLGRQFLLHGDLGSDAVNCLDGFQAPDGQAARADLHVGRLGDGSGALTRVGAIIMQTAEARASKLPGRYSRTITRDGKYLLWSTVPDEGPQSREALFLMEIGQPPASARMLAASGAFSQLSADGRHIFYIDMPSPAATRGSLVVADFPSGANPQVVEADVTSYAEVARPDGSAALVVLTGQYAGPAQVRDLPGSPSGSRLGELTGNISRVQFVAPDRKSVVLFGPPLLPAPGWSVWMDFMDPARVGCGLKDQLTHTPSGTFSSSGRFLLASFFDGPTAVASQEIFDGCTSRLQLPKSHGFVALPGDKFLVTARSNTLKQAPQSALYLVSTDDSGAVSTSELQKTVTGNVGIVSVPAKGGGLSTFVIHSVAAGWGSDGVFIRPLSGSP